MNKFRRILLVALLGLTSSAMTASLAACDKTPEETPHTHEYSWEITKPATCKEQGEKKGTCSCGDTQTEVLEKTAHSPKTEAGKDATCVEAGKTESTVCSVCGEVLTAATVIDATGKHTYDEGKVTKEATCTEDGEKTYTCTACNDTKTEVIYSEGHKWNDGVETKAPTCTEDGVTTVTCTVCNATEERAIDKTGHNYAESTEDASYHAPTCASNGYWECTNGCGTGVKFNPATATNNHNYVDGICSVCGATDPQVYTYTKYETFEAANVGTGGGTLAENYVSGSVTVLSGTEYRDRTRSFPAEGLNFTHSLKMGHATDIVEINVAKTGYIKIYVSNGSSSVGDYASFVVERNGNAMGCSYLTDPTGKGKPASNENVQAVTVYVQQGDALKIYRTEGTTDLFRIEFYEAEGGNVTYLTDLTYDKAGEYTGKLDLTSGTENFTNQYGEVYASKKVTFTAPQKGSYAFCSDKNALLVMVTVVMGEVEYYAGYPVDMEAGATATVYFSDATYGEGNVYSGSYTLTINQGLHSADKTSMQYVDLKATLVAGEQFVMIENDEEEFVIFVEEKTCYTVSGLSAGAALYVKEGGVYEAPVLTPVVANEAGVYTLSGEQWGASYILKSSAGKVTFTATEAEYVEPTYALTVTAPEGTTYEVYSVSYDEETFEEKLTLLTDYTALVEGQYMIKNVTLPEGTTLSAILCNGEELWEMEGVYFFDIFGDTTVEITPVKAVSFGEESKAIANPGNFYYWNDQDWCGSNVQVVSTASASTYATFSYTGATTACWFGFQVFYKNAENEVGKTYKLTFILDSEYAGEIKINGVYYEITVGENEIEVIYTESATVASLSIQMGQDARKVDGEDVEATVIEENTFTVSNMMWMEYVAYTVTFEQPATGGTFTVTYDGDTEGIASGSKLEEFTMLEITPDADADYVIDKVLVNGQPVTPTDAGEYYVMLQQDITIVVTFKLDVSGSDDAITSNMSFSAAECTEAEYAEATVVATGIRILATTGKPVKVDASNKTFGDKTFTNRIKLGGKAATSGGEIIRAIEITVAQKTTITVYCLSSSASADRSIDLMDASLNVLQTGTAYGANTVPVTFTVEAGTYYLGSKENGINIYGMDFTVV